MIQRLVGRRVATVAVSYVVPHVSLHLPAWTADNADSAVDYVVQIDGPTRFASAPKEIDPETGPHEAFTELLGRRVTGGAAAEDGTLRLEVEGGEVLTVPPSVYEPWQVYGSDG